MFVTYAHNFEDLMLWRALGHIKGGFYIDVGANHPDHESVTKAFYLAGWRGINIEPEREMIDALNAVRPEDINLCMAAGFERGPRTFYSVDACPALSSLSERMANEHRKAGRSVREIKIEVRTLAEICAEHVGDREIHFLKVDVEGKEADVFRGHDFDRWRPWIIVSESHSSDPEAGHYLPTERYLEGVGYPFIYTDGLNRFYVDKVRQKDFRRAFLVPPNVYDRWIRATELDWRKRAEVAEAENHCLYHLIAK